MTVQTQYDVIVIGAGPGGYVAAIRAAQLGMRVACVERGPALGGTCLNVGCIPSKALLSVTAEYAALKNHGAEVGIEAADLSFNLSKLMAHKNAVVGKLTQGIAFLFKKNKVTSFSGTATLEGSGVVHVTGRDEEVTRLQAPHIIIATGSEVVTLPTLPVDGKRIVTSTEALALEEVPKTLAVVGGGYIGLELASVWSRLGAQVTVIEVGERIVPAMDHSVGDALMGVLQKQGIVFHLNTTVTRAEVQKHGVTLALKSGDTTEALTAEVVLVAVGRTPHTGGLGLEAIGIQVDTRGAIPVNARFETTCPGVYAIGDVIPGPMLAHKAEEEGIAVAEIIAGQQAHVNYSAIPAVIYTDPEVASVGETEEQLMARGVAFKVGRAPLSANGRALAQNTPDGFVKILTNAATDRILGVHIIGPDAGTLIAEAVLALEYAASAEDIARTSHAHPTLNEVLREAAFAAWNMPLHG